MSELLPHVLPVLTQEGTQEGVVEAVLYLAAVGCFVIAVTLAWLERRR